MRAATSVFGIITVMFANGSAHSLDVGKNPDLDKMQGNWKIVRYEFTGKEGAAKSEEAQTIQGEKWLRPKKATAEYRLKLDPTKEPKWVDLSADRLGDKILKGIYRFDGDKLVICYAYDPDLPRPAEFKTKEGVKGYLYVLEPQKAGKEVHGGISADVVEAWKKAGASLVWMAPNADGNGLSITTVRPANAKTTPGFSFKVPPQDAFRNLPKPGVPFGLQLTPGNTDLRKLKVIDADLQGLSGMMNLTVLYLSGANVTDAGLKELSGLVDLQSLAISRTLVSDAGVKELAKLQNLQDLKLGGTKFTDAGLKELSGLMSQLRELNLSGTKVTDGGLKELAGLQKLRALEFQNTQVSDAGLKEIARVIQLQSLDLRGSAKLTDAGMKVLAALKRLLSLQLPSQISDATIAELQIALPICKITKATKSKRN